MNFNSYQEAALKNAMYPNLGDNLPYTMLGLAGEAGECAEHVKKMLRDDGGKLTAARKVLLARELGDVLWYLSAVSFEIGVSLNAIAEINLEKLLDRRARGVLQGSGSER